ncbi:response regulator transcription factor [Ilyomonas limi]|uniref:Response regulator transcription factor n=1 Tax=Ilyomonas limi TaxID=2575867 RepID=A0A4U3KVZ5_9BACT|nr:response regulator transcription factor [Ilyomonas limi]TKK65236.1 response regulator transcription factor [Ilyomonas limi]
MKPTTEEILPAIVVIEDDPYMQGVLKHCLRDHFQPILFNNGLDALAHFQAGNIPDIIISDLNTPRLNGVKFLEQIKSSGFFNDIPVVILSGEDNTDTRIKCLEIGADDFVLKPFNPRELNARLKGILKRSNKMIAG